MDQRVEPRWAKRTINRRTRGTAVVVTLGIATIELLRCGSVISIPEGPASTIASVLVLFGTPFFIGMAVRQWLVAMPSGLVGLYGLVWMCHLLSDIQIYYEPPMGILILLIYPVGWSAVVLAWLGSRVPWALLRIRKDVSLGSAQA